MKIVFNDLSTHFVASSDDEANSWLSTFFEVHLELSKRLHKIIYIESAKKFMEVIVGENYPFSQWLHTLKDKDVIRTIVNILQHEPLIKSYPEYTYQTSVSNGLGHAYSENTFAISYPENRWDKNIEIVKTYIREDTYEIISERCIVKNIAKVDDVFYFHPRRSFEHYAKHDNKRTNLLDGESTLHYSIPEQVSVVKKLLDCSIGDETSKRLYNFDEKFGLFMEFNEHFTLTYHGYHIENQNRVPDAIKKKIRDFRQQ